jgi:hypothetical protein
MSKPKVICINADFQSKIKGIEYPIKGGVYTVLDIANNGRELILDGYQHTKTPQFDTMRFALWKARVIDILPNQESKPAFKPDIRP